MAEVMREKLCKEYGEQVAELRAEAKGRKKLGKKDLSQRIDTGSRADRSTDAKLAKAAGTPGGAVMLQETCERKAVAGDVRILGRVLA